MKTDRGGGFPPPLFLAVRFELVFAQNAPNFHYNTLPQICQEENLYKNLP